MNIIDYDQVLERYAAYKESDFKDIRALSKSYCQSEGINGFDQVTQANTAGCQCVLHNNDIVLNVVEYKRIGGLAQMLPPDATDREVVDEVKLGGISLAELIHWASDAQWARVIDGRGRTRARDIFTRISEVVVNKMDYYYIHLIVNDGPLLRGFVTERDACQHIEDALASAAGHTIDVWYAYEKAAMTKLQL